MNLTASRRAASAAQAILSESDKDLVVDGKVGSYTIGVYRRSPIDLRNAVDSIVKSLGFPGGLESLYGMYQQAKLAGTGASTIFDLKVVPAIVREARRRGLNASFFLTQLCLESGYGKSTPMGDDGRPSLNFAGLKWNSVTPRTTRKATAGTTEFVRGNATKSIEVFAAFDTPDAFAKAYFAYLLEGPSSYRYVGLTAASTGREFGDILQKGGYATDPQYAIKFANSVKTVERKYALA